MSYHVLLAGSTGSGKSNAMKFIIADQAICDASTQFYMIDLKRVELSQFKKLRQLNAYATTKEKALSVLHEVYNLMEDRYKIMERKNMTNWSGGACYLCIDEVAELTTTQDRKYNREVIDLLSSIARLGRASKVFLIIATQYPTAKVLPMQLLQNIEYRYCFRQASDIGYRVVLGSSRSIPKNKLSVGIAVEHKPMHNDELVKFPLADSDYIKPAVEKANKNHKETMKLFRKNKFKIMKKVTA